MLVPTRAFVAGFSPSGSPQFQLSVAQVHGSFEPEFRPFAGAARAERLVNPVERKLQPPRSGHGFGCDESVPGGRDRASRAASGSIFQGSWGGSAAARLLSGWAGWSGFQWFLLGVWIGRTRRVLMRSDGFVQAGSTAVRGPSISFLTRCCLPSVEP